MNNKLAFFLCMFLHIPIYGIIINGDPASTSGTNTFSFPLIDAQYNQQNATLWTFNVNAVGGTSAPYAISSIQDGALSAIAQTSTNATISLTSGVTPIVTTGANPFYTGTVGRASLWTPSSAGNSALPVCVGGVDGTHLYAFSNIIIADDTSSMYKFLAPGSRNISGLQGLSSSLYYAASDFGTGVPNYVGFLVETPSAGNVKYLSEASNISFDGSVAYLKQGTTDLTINNTAPALCTFNNNMYVGLSVRGGDGTSGGAAAFLATLGAGYALTPLALLPSNGNGQNTVLSVATNADLLIIDDVQVMNTSTGLTYLIIHKYSNNGGTISEGVYTVPIVTAGLSADYGKVAQYTNASYATDIAITSDPSTNMILSKGFQTPLTTGTLTQIATATGPVSLTVGGALPAAILLLDNFSVVGDNVYITTPVGAYFSKALFDQYGAIAGWTPWQITHAATWPAGISQTSGTVDGNTGKGWFSRSLSGGTSIVQRTEWNNTSNPLLEMQNTVSAFIPNSLVQNIFDLPSTLSVFSGSPLSGIVYTGKNNVLAATTGNNAGAGGSYYPLNPATSQVFGDAAAVGHVVAFEIGVDTAVTPNVSWAFAAGQNGIAVSSSGGAVRGGVTPAGSGGGNPLADITTLFPNSFTLISTLPYVKKLQTATNGDSPSCLYALNSQGIYRITLTGTDFSAPTILTPTPIFLASSLGPNVSFTDFIASTISSFGNVQFVVGTTQGLYIGYDGVSLTQVQLPSIQSVQRLVPQAALTATNNNLYVVAGDFANDQTEIVRFYLDRFGSIVISDSLIPIQDQTYVGVNKPFVTMYNFQNTFWWQGSCGLFGMSGRLGSLNPIVKILKSGVTGSMSSNQSIWMYFLSTLSIPGIAGSTYLTTTLQDSAYGALQLGGGDFGIQVLS